MPQELLRDVVRTNDASGRARRRWSVLPVSIVLHTAILGAVVIIPVAAEVDLPDPYSLVRIMPHIRAAAIPPEPPPPRTGPAPAVNPGAAPASAPTGIEPEAPVEHPPSPPPGIAVEGGIGSAATVLPGSETRQVPDPPPPPVQPEPIRVGGNLRPPVRIGYVPPIYPAVARQAQVQGVVILEAVISEQGIVEQVRVLRSEPLLDEAAIEAVRKWRYAPTLLNGVPVPVMMTVAVRFTLRE